MKLRSKTILTLAAVLAVMTVVLVSIVSDLVINNALKEERNAIDMDLERATANVHSRNTDLQQNVIDWAVWDATYDLVQGLNPNYIDENLQQGTMVNLELNIVLFYNNTMGLYQMVSYDYLNNETIELSDELLGAITANLTMMTGSDPVSGDGLMLLNHSILALAYHEIRDTAGTAPAIGTMVMARFITPEIMMEISSAIMVTTLIYLADAPESSDLDPSTWDDIVLNGAVVLQTGENNTISASKAILGIDGKAVAVLQIQSPRSIYGRSMASIGLISATLFVIVLAFLVVSLVTTDLFTLRRIQRLSKQVVEVGKTGNAAKRVQMDGSDELTDLAFEVNRTLDAISSAERNLQESEKRYKAILNDQNELIFRMRPDGTITFSNDALLKELHREGGDIIGMSSREVLPMFISEALDSHCKEAAASGGSITKDYRFFHRREEKEKWYSLSLRAIYSEGKVEEFQGVVMDLTEIKEAEISLVEANKKLNLLASVSRQNVMNQLTVAQGFVSIALSEEKEPRTMEHLKKAEAAIRSINGHLEFTRDYQRTGMVIPVWINLSDSLEKAAVDFRSKGINIAIDVSNIDVLADPLAEKVFYNLIENSDKHGNGVKNIRISAEKMDNELLVAFEDDGRGIPQKDKERIFEVSSGMNASYGLFLAREILSSAGITIRENGVEGKGARFEVMFPSNRFRQTPKMIST